MKVCNALFLSLALAACAAPPPRIASGHVHHVVVVWLEQPDDPVSRQAVIEASYELRKIPGVLELSAGAALPSDRDRLYTDFDLAVHMVLEDPDALQAYLVHPIHQRLKDEVLDPLVLRYRIIDFVD